MKQFFTTIIAILYLATSTGATVTLHYCMGEVVAKGRSEKQACGKCGMEKKDGCCGEQVKVVKTQDSHAFQAVDFSCTPPFVLLHSGYQLVNSAPVISATAPVAQSNSPPGSSGILLCILHCVFRL